MSNQSTAYSIKIDPSMIMETSAGLVEEDDILYQPLEETVYVLENTCVMATASATSHSAGGKPSPAKGKIVLQKKPTKAALRKQQRDLLKECIQEFDGQDCEEIVIAPSHQRPSSNAPRVVEKPVAPPRVAPKIILKSVGHALTKKDCELIKDCVEALADQDCVETFKLRTRVDHLCKAEWWKISDIVVKLMHQYLPENGVEVIDHTHIEQARYQMKETYKWAGYVVGKDFIYSERIRSIKQDSCYEAMRKRNNDMRPRKAISKRTSAQYSASKKVRLANSYGVLVFEDLDEGKISNQKRLNYKAFCAELSMLPVGHQFTQQQIELADNYWDCLMASMKNADPNQFHTFQATGELAILRHIRLYLNFVRKITKREDTVIHKFQENCDLYLLCLEDLLKSFPPGDLYDIKGLDVKSSPYISLVKIIASQLGRGTSFIVDPDVSTEVSIDETGPICLVKNGNFYDLWINGVIVVPHMQEIQAIFCLATSEDVFCISQKSSSDSSDVIDFMRKFLLLIPDFHTKRPKATSLGQGFFCITELYKTKMGANSKPSKFLCYDKAKEAIDVL